MWYLNVLVHKHYIVQPQEIPMCTLKTSTCYQQSCIGHCFMKWLTNSIILVRQQVDTIRLIYQFLYQCTSTRRVTTKIWASISCPHLQNWEYYSELFAFTGCWQQKWYDRPPHTSDVREAVVQYNLEEPVKAKHFHKGVPRATASQ